MPNVCPLKEFGCNGPITVSDEEAKFILGAFYKPGMSALVCGLYNFPDMTKEVTECEVLLNTQQINPPLSSV